jgi:dipeptidase D
MLENIQPEKVFRYFEEISRIPRGSGDMLKIADYCEAFAKKNSLKYVRDNANNVIIYKAASKGYENAEPIILQGHLDIVCQKTEEKEIDFLTDGLDVFVDGDFVAADGTTLGADNGIAVSMILAILESDEYSHPAIEAVLTTDEEIGMIGATKLDMSLLHSKKMINLDS